jgi:hypothetical protein
MKDASVDWPVQRLTSMISRESLMRALTETSCESLSSGLVAEGLMVMRVEGVEWVCVRGVFGGSVEKRRWMS